MVGCVLPWVAGLYLAAKRYWLAAGCGVGCAVEALTESVPNEVAPLRADRSPTRNNCRTIRSRRGMVLSADTQAPQMASLQMRQMFWFASLPIVNMTYWTRTSASEIYGTHPNIPNNYTVEWSLLDYFQTQTFCIWHQHALPAAGWCIKQANWGNTGTRNAGDVQWAGQRGQLTWRLLWAGWPPCCQELLPT